ncbi:hypothetical protein F2Q69_00011841 [Brassica cretica]|uniref:Uncharacterized protein n=1 Tax=Brassica cretica TaxID=69181 RepID=A0A8S9QZY4_BRACR|nr:hypothetical protein F2Q69_00011841 [Brassica cretica]
MQRRTLFRPYRSQCSEWRVGLSSVATLRPSCVRAWSLCSDRAWLELDHYVATELCTCSVATVFGR